MTKKDFVEMARIISGVIDANDRMKMARLFADMCERNNPRFDRYKFYKACGVD